MVFEVLWTWGVEDRVWELLLAAPFRTVLPWSQEEALDGLEDMVVQIKRKRGHVRNCRLSLVLHAELACFTCSSWYTMSALLSFQRADIVVLTMIDNAELPKLSSSSLQGAPQRVMVNSYPLQSRILNQFTHLLPTCRLFSRNLDARPKLHYEY